MRLHETITTEGMGPDRVDREAGVIRGVRILGRQSTNGRSYSDRAQDSAAGMYEGRKAYLDHSLKERSFREWVGRWQNIKVTGSGDDRHVTGDLRFLKEGRYAAMLVEAASEFATDFGVSHDAEGKVSGQRPNQIVEDIEKVHSIDIVTDPATSRALFESHQEDDGEPTVEKKSITAILMEAAKSEAAKTPEYKLLREMTLREMDGDMAMPAEVAVEPDMKPEEQIKAGILAAIVAKLESADVAMLKKVMKDVGLGDPLEAASGGEAPKPEGGEEKPPEEKPKESEEVVRLKAQLAEQQKRSASASALAEANIPATSARVKAFAACETDGERKELIESWKVKEDVQKPRFSRPLYDADDFKGDDYSKLTEGRKERILG